MISTLERRTGHDRSQPDAPRAPGRAPLRGLFGAPADASPRVRRTETLDPTPEWAAMFAPPRHQGSNDSQELNNRT